MQALGVSDQRFLGTAGARDIRREPRRYLDSGMVWGDDGKPKPLPDVDARSLCSAPLDEVINDILAVIEDAGADAVVSYDAHGGYGHPDHVRAAEAARLAAARAGLPFYEIVEPGGDPDIDDVVVDVGERLPQKRAALRAHTTQVTVSDDGTAFALSSGPERTIAVSERFRFVPVTVGRAPVAKQGIATLVASCVVASVIGVVVGALLTVHHQQSLMLAGVAVPAGVIVGLAVVAALLAGIRIVFDNRGVAACAALGILVISYVLAQRGPGGSVMVPANEAGYVWAYGPVVVSLLVLAWPRLRPAGER